MELIASSLVEEFGCMVPELRFAGGSFNHWLPRLCEISPSDREQILLATQRSATRKCLTDLLTRVGLTAVEPKRLPSGARQWPAGYTGSVSHKRNKVVASIAPTGRMVSIGIDIEHIDKQHFPCLSGLGPDEQPWAGSNAAGSLILLSVKESVYKALNPIFGRRLGFQDVIVSWVPSFPPCCRGNARACGVTLDVRCSVAVPSWIISVALWPATVGPSRISS